MSSKFISAFVVLTITTTPVLAQSVYCGDLLSKISSDTTLNEYGRFEKRHPNLFGEFSLDYFRVRSTKNYFLPYWKKQFWNHVRKLEAKDPGVIRFENLYMIYSGKHLSMKDLRAQHSPLSNQRTLRDLFRGKEELLLPIYKFAGDRLNELNRGAVKGQTFFSSSREQIEYQKYGVEGPFTIDEMRLAIGGPEFTNSLQKDDHVHVDPYYSIVALIDGDGLLYYTHPDPRNGNWKVHHALKQPLWRLRTELDNLVTNPSNGFVEHKQQPDTFLEMNGSERGGTIVLPHKAASGRESRMALIIFFKPVDYIDPIQSPTLYKYNRWPDGRWSPDLFDHPNLSNQSVKPIYLFPGSDD